VRIRIALATATAVFVLPALVFGCISNSPAKSAASTPHQDQSHASRLAQSELTSYTVPPTEHLAFDTDLKVGIDPPAPAPAPAPVAQPVARIVPVAAPVARPAIVAAPAVVASGDSTSVATADWSCIRWHESRDNYTDGNGGAYQFEQGTWQALTGLPSPAEDYPPATQDAAALKLYSERGWEPWSTRYVCGL
jgi:hypothetical protein